MDRLRTNSGVLRDALEREGFDIRGSRTQIVPLVVGDASLAMRICEAALGRGVFAQAIRPPTVAPGSSRLRLAVMASHREEELRSAARTLAQVARAEGFEPRTRSLPIVEGEEDLEREESRPTRVFDFEQPERWAA